ncbi:MAG: hypothetical protein HGA33_05360 [Candidatus Moranbacteria bacterium]|nr:hypothetical protein [Candidatus Moranbacteria bacterium]
MTKKTSGTAAPEAKKTPTTAEKREEARKLAEQLCAALGISHTFLSELLIEAANCISSEQPQSETGSDDKYGALATRAATPLEIAGTRLLKRHEKNHGAGKIFNRVRLQFLKQLIAGNALGTFMTHNQQKDYLNNIFYGTSVVVTKDNAIMVVNGGPQHCSSQFHRGNIGSIVERLFGGDFGVSIVEIDGSDALHDFAARNAPHSERNGQ